MIRQTDSVVVVVEALGVSVGFSALSVNKRPSKRPAVMDGSIWRKEKSISR